MMKVVFMGTPVFAVPSLQALAGAGFDMTAVVTRPDRPSGRGKKVQLTPVKKEALGLGIPVFQPEKVREDTFVSLLRGLQPHIIIVVAFGQILPAEILDIPPLGCVNVHSSLLPKYRGAAPMQRAIMNGESQTGVTTMLMERGLDSGDILLQSSMQIGVEDSFGKVHDRLSKLGSKLLLETVELLAQGKLSGVPQNHEKATYAPPITRDDEVINWHNRAGDIKNQVRGLSPRPGARTAVGEKVLKIWNVGGPERNSKLGAGNATPGCVIGFREDGLAVHCGDYPLVIKEMQIQGGKRLGAAEFLRGFRIQPGTQLG